MVLIKDKTKYREKKGIEKEVESKKEIERGRERNSLQWRVKERGIACDLLDLLRHEARRIAIWSEKSCRCAGADGAQQVCVRQAIEHAWVVWLLPR